LRIMNDVKKALVINDSAVIRDAYRRVLENAGFDVEEAGDKEKAVNAAAATAYDLTLLDLKMPERSSLNTLKSLKEARPDSPVVMLAESPTIETAIEAMRCGAADFLTKPFTAEAMRLINEKILRKSPIDDEDAYLAAKMIGGRDRYRLVGESAEIKSVHSLVRRVAPTNSTVLITGESGTGKELFARALHRYSARTQKPFVVVDCNTLVGTLFESELFGHTKGAFTGASATTHWRFELADGGTVFFDEIGNVTPDIQSKLLRVIQEREFARVGSNKVLTVDVRIVAATNHDLLDAVKAGTFREDLYYRLCVVPITLPPLRQHKEDIPILADYFLKKYRFERKKDVQSIDSDVMEILLANNWPGNVRELENAIERAVILTTTDSIKREDILHYAYTTQKMPEKPLSLKVMEAAHIRSVLKQTRGNRGLAARYLEIDRKTLWRKIKEYNINT